MYETFEMLCKENGVSAYKVGKETGISTSTLSNWKKGTYTPKQDKMQKIADYFNVPLEYLLTGTMPVAIEESSEPFISSFERELIEHYRSADPDIKKSVRKLLDIKEEGLNSVSLKGA